MIEITSDTNRDRHVWLANGSHLGRGPDPISALFAAETELLSALHFVRQQLAECGAVHYGDPSVVLPVGRDLGDESTRP